MQLLEVRNCVVVRVDPCGSGKTVGCKSLL